MQSSSQCRWFTLDELHNIFSWPTLSLFLYGIYLHVSTVHRPVNLHPLFLFWKNGLVCDPEKKSGPKSGMQKAGCKKQGHCYSKREEAAALFSFWIIMTLFFAPCFLHPIFLTWFFSGSQTDPCFQNKNSGCKLTGRWCLIRNTKQWYKLIEAFISSAKKSFIVVQSL